jgi:hypothetical protein
MNSFPFEVLRRVYSGLFWRCALPRGLTSAAIRALRFALAFSMYRRDVDAPQDYLPIQVKFETLFKKEHYLPVPCSGLGTRCVSISGKLLSS